MRFEEYKAALVHHWFVRASGGERVCDAICEMLGTSPDIYSLVMDPDCLTDFVRGSRHFTSFIQHLPGSRRNHRRPSPARSC